MNTHADKTQENKKQSVANSITPKQGSSGSTFQFVDNRPEAVVQKKLQALVYNSPQAKQAAQLQAIADNHSAKQQPLIQKKENSTGLPDNLKTGMENLSGASLDHVKVHYNSAKPATVQAHAYAQGSEIHLASGQEKHLPHELGHVVQQMEGRVKPTTSVGGMAVNDNAGLENEATVMGNKALSSASTTPLQAKLLNTGGTQLSKPVQQHTKVIQREILSNEAWNATCISLVPSAMITTDLIFMTAALNNYHKEHEVKELDTIIKRTTSWIAGYMKEKPAGMADILNRVGSLQTAAKQEKKILAKAELKAEIKNTIVGELTQTSGKKGADELFAKFMKYGQSNWKYVTKGSDVLSGAKAGACGSFANAFCHLLKSTGIDNSAEVILAEQNFITNKLPGTFIDPSCPGNVKVGSGDYAAERKFYFSKHWIVNTKFGTYDPTNGTPAAASVWQKGFKATEEGIWKNGSYQLQLVDHKHVTGGGYLLSKL